MLFIILLGLILLFPILKLLLGISFFDAVFEIFSTIGDIVIIIFFSIIIAIILIIALSLIFAIAEMML